MGTLAEPAGDASSSSTVAISSGVSSNTLLFYNIESEKKGPCLVLPHGSARDSYVLKFCKGFLR